MRNQNDFQGIHSEQEARFMEWRTKNRPHVVLLGAGASCAAIPNGDKSGKRITPMQGFCRAMGIDSYLSNFHLHTQSDNLEDIYMEIDKRSQKEPEFTQLKKYLESKIREYLSTFQLPDTPTIYDFLLLGLRRKDIVATFNWDPLLVQAAIRVRQITKRIPKILFLHGNVGVKYKVHEDGITKLICGPFYKNSNDDYVDMPLLYPVRQKNYSQIAVIERQWTQLKSYLGEAYRFTIFGYGAPKSDVDAISLLKDGWGNAEKRNMEEIEIIDIKNENELHESWKDFVFSHHFSTMTNFFESSIAKYPRRTCEELFDTTLRLDCEKTGMGFKPGMSFNDISLELSVLIAEEDDDQYDRILTDPYVEPFEEWIKN